MTWDRQPAAEWRHLQDQKLHRYLNAIEMTPNAIEVHSMPAMLQRIKLETALKEVRVLDNRPAG